MVCCFSFIFLRYGNDVRCEKLAIAGYESKSVGKSIENIYGYFYGHLHFHSLDDLCIVSHL